MFDDNRLYRRTDPPIPDDSGWKPKSNTLKAQAARRRVRRESKRRRVRGGSSVEPADDDDESKFEDTMDLDEKPDEQADGGLGDGFKWECVCITLQQYKEFVDAHKKSRDPNERNLISRIEEDVMPILEKAEEAQLRKIQKRERELQAMEKLAHAKRSSRLAGKHERERIQKEQEETEKKRSADLAAARKAEEQQRKMQEERQYRMMTREQRIRDREHKRILHEEELARMEEEAQRIEAGETGRGSRHLKAHIEKTKKDLEELQDEDEWMFDCAGCGMHGKNLDDGEHSVQCEKCNVWQHSKCHGISQAEAENDDFHFICKDCRQKEEDAKKPKIPPLKFRVGSSSSPPAEPPPTIEVTKKPRGRPRKTASPGQTGASANPELPQSTPRAFQNQTPRSFSNGIQSPEQFRPQQSPYPVPSPSKPAPPKQSSHTSDIFRASPYQRQIMSHMSPPSNGVNFNGQAYRPYMQMSPPPPSHQKPPVSGSNQRPSSASVPNGTPYQQRPSSSCSTQALAGTPAPARNVPSPMQNRPSMSPTQGNPEVGPLAGVPTPRPISSYNNSSAVPATPQPFTPNGVDSQGTNSQISSQTPLNHNLSTPLVNHMSGRSPTKHSPPPSSFEESSSQNPGNGIQPSGRSVSGTPIFPPTSTLQPSPKQLDKTPVPTPSKNGSPLRQGDSDLARVMDETAELVRKRIESHQPVLKAASGGSDSGSQ